MKAKRMVALAAAIVMVLALSSAAYAIPSPKGSNVAGTSDNVTKVEVKPITATQQAVLENTAASYVQENEAEFGAGAVVETLLSMDLKITRRGSDPVTISMNVAGVAMLDTIYVVHQKANGSIEMIKARVLADGLIEFTLSSFSPISIIRIKTDAVLDPVKIPKTGDDTTTVPMAMLLVGCAAIAVVCGKVLKKAK